MTLGEELINELSRRGLRGRYFSYTQYRQLRGIESAEALQQFVDASGIRDINASEGVAAIAERLQASEAQPVSIGLVIWLVLGDLFLFGIPRLFWPLRRNR